MKISLSWLRQYVNIDTTPEETSRILTDIGLEVEGLEEFNTVEGGLEGLVIGEVLTCEQHPNADRLKVTTVNVGNAEALHIVCGAPNVAAGQKVVVATVGTTLYPTGGDSFKIKKGKIRGEVSEGMICAEDEIGLGTDHDGIMVLDADARVGQPAAEYFNLETDYVFEIGLTPNRVDAASHFGTARDLAAFYSLQGDKVQAAMPDTSAFAIDNTDLTIPVTVEDHAACPRYAGVTISGVTVADSPEWLQARLRSIGLSPINNVVDITNFVLHELGQPLHAFDADVVDGAVIVKQVPEKTKFTTLDEVERELSDRDLMICNAKGGMCIAGVFGGIDSGVSEGTTKIFLESATFNAVSVRKTARRHGLSTDASFRFERGTDPEMVLPALKRAALLIKEIAGGSISSEIVDIYPEPAKPFSVEFSWANCTRLIGKELPKDMIRGMFESLEIEVASETDDTLQLLVPPYRVDVQREADVIEEVLRLYGYNNVELPAKVNASLSYHPKPDPEAVRERALNHLADAGFNESMSNSLTRSSYYTGGELWNESELVRILNPLSSELDVMRMSLLYSGLEAIQYNRNRKRPNLKLAEFGRVYHKVEDKHRENQRLGLWITGRKQPESWNSSDDAADVYMAKAYLENLFHKLGISRPGVQTKPTDNPVLAGGLSYFIINKKVADLGPVKPEILGAFDIDSEVLFADIDWDVVLSLLKVNKVKYSPIAKFPAVRRDLALLVDNGITFGEIADIVRKSERKLLTDVNLFDVYEGKNLGAGKKSYAVSMQFQDEHKTLTDKQVDKMMAKIVSALENGVGAKLR